MGLGAELVEQWRDMGSTLWIVAGAAALAWFVLLGVLAALTEPRRVEPGPATLELGGAEPPAVVNLVTGDWDLGHEAVPATLLDLAARKHLAVDQVGDDTLVRVARSRDDQLTGYERMVLDHVSALARHTDDGVVPANALTTGPGEDSKRWWRRFRNEVHDDARARGLSRARWSTTQRLVLILGAMVVAGCVGWAASTMPVESEDSDDSQGGAMVWSAGMTFIGLLAVVTTTQGERDTPDGRASAARWLGLREQLGDNTLFADQPPAAVAIWDRHLAYGAALGLAHGAVRALPLGAESDRVAWSPTLLSEDTTAASQAAAGALAVVAAALVARGGWMVYAGVADLVQGRRTIEGRVLRCRTRGDDENRRWYVAVDDGTTDRIRAWRFRSAPAARQGLMMRAEVSPRTGHVRDLEPVPTPSPTSVNAG